jgi:hypothetical protein
VFVPGCTGATVVVVGEVVIVDKALEASPDSGDVSDVSADLVSVVSCAGV